MRSSHSGALVWRLLDARRHETVRPGSRRLKHLRVLVEVRCGSPRSHELAYVYKIPGDVMDKVTAREGLGFLHGELLFASTDNQRFVPGESWRIEGDQRIDEGDLLLKKEEWRKHNEPITPHPTSGRQPYSLNLSVGQRRWAALVDVLDFRPDEDAEHAVLECRCRCGTRPVADRRELMALAQEALADGATRRVFL